MGAYSPWGCKDSDTIERLNNKPIIIKVFLLLQIAMAAVFQCLEQYWYLLGAQSMGLLHD